MACNIDISQCYIGLYGLLQTKISIKNILEVCLKKRWGRFTSKANESYALRGDLF